MKIKILHTLTTIIMGLVTFFLIETAFSVKIQAYSEKDPLVVVSMGDSYSAGSGVFGIFPNKSSYIKFFAPFYGQKENDSDDPLAKDKSRKEKLLSSDWCAHRSTMSWPSMLKISGIEVRKYKKDLKGNSNSESSPCEWYFVAAEGATTYDFHDFQHKNDKVWTKKGLLPPIYYVEESNTAYKLKPQIDVFKDNKLDNRVDYVTMSIGGNDLGFQQIVENGIFSLFNPNGLAAELDKKRRLWDNEFKEKLIDTYIKVYEEAGSQADIIVVGYPELYYRDTQTFAAGKDQRKLIDDFVVEFCDKENGKIKKAIDEANKEIKTNHQEITEDKIHYVSVIEKFREDGGHGADAPEPWINGITLMGTEQVSELGVGLYPSMHPNLEGTKSYAECVNAEIEKIEQSKKQSADNQNANAIKNYTWSVEPTIDAEDIIVFDANDIGINHYQNARGQKIANAKEYVIIKNDNKFAFIDYNSNKLSNYYDHYTVCACGAIDLFNMKSNITSCYYLNDKLKLKKSEYGCAHGGGYCVRYYDTETNEFKDASYYYPGIFEDGTGIAVNNNNSKNSLFALVNNNKLSTDFIFEDIESKESISMSELTACKKDGKWGYYKCDGTEVIPCQFDDIHCYHQNIKWNDGSTYETEKNIFLPTEGYIAVNKNGGYGYYNTKGEEVIPCGEFEQARPVYGGKAWVKKNGKWGVIKLSKNNSSSDDNESQLKQAVKEKAGCEPADWFYDDFDNDGTKEAFALVGDKWSKDKGTLKNVYFVDSNKQVNEVRFINNEEDDDGWGELGYAQLAPYYSSCKITKYNGRKFFSFETDYGASGFTAFVFSVKNSNYYELDISGRICSFNGKTATISKFHEGGGHYWPTIKLRYDENEGEFYKDD